MLRNFRLVILDYPKVSIKQAETQRALSDTIVEKQVNFERASMDYIPMSGLDMLSTHYLIYDIRNLFKPKQVLAIRTCFEKRVARHNLNLPIDEYIRLAPEEYQNRFREFRKQNFPLVDCNGLYVDPEFSYSKSGLPLPEIGYFALVTYILRKGFSNWVGATNERFKASRWGLMTGESVGGATFTHHKVKDPHLLIMIENFNYQWLSSCVDKYGSFLRDAYEIFPDSAVIDETLKPLDAVFEEILLKAKANSKDYLKLA